MSNETIEETSSQRYFPLVREAFASLISTYFLREVEISGSGPERRIVFRNRTTELRVTQEIGSAPFVQIFQLRTASHATGPLKYVSLEPAASFPGVAAPYSAPRLPGSIPPEALRSILVETAALLAARYSLPLAGDFSDVPSPQQP